MQEEQQVTTEVLQQEHQQSPRQQGEQQIQEDIWEEWNLTQGELSSQAVTWPSTSSQQAMQTPPMPIHIMHGQAGQTIAAPTEGSSEQE